MLRTVLDSGWLGKGEMTERFETAMAKFVGHKHFVSTSSCTAALHLAVKALSLPKGAQVITTPNTFVSTNAVLLYEGLVPLFADIDRTSGNMDIDKVLECPRSHAAKAVMIVHFGGKPAEAGRFWELGIPVIEDCAHALGAKLPPTNNLRCWSFHAVKNLPMGDGGGISTNDDKVAERLRSLRWMGITTDTHARSKGSYKWEYDIRELGFKYHMNDVTAAIGLAQMVNVEKHNQRRREIAQRYYQDIKCLDSEFPQNSSFHFLPLMFADRKRITDRLKSMDIEFGMHYKGNDNYAPFKNCPKLTTLTAMRWYEARELTLPIHPRMTDQDVEKVIRVVNGV